jgi:hypothetical protein
MRIVDSSHVPILRYQQLSRGIAIDMDIIDISIFEKSRIVLSP